MSEFWQQGRLLELNAADWLLLLAGIAFAAVLAVIFGF